ncbi:MAG: tRNA (adenosine(37)-N6)-threonylcarbamoyltransferase complex ATPase subunit type 1 TsaE [Planctomycetota bacterium]|nr:tRNA (adenosine(37)-N6)-threonylcarbamoyltransferase complex ATPase subunit type 1 TsaE [Planctomycetota bacterium]
MAVERQFLTHDEEGTEALGEAFGRACLPGTVIALTGELGAGKTCFVRGLALGLGITEGVASPSYTLMQAHEGGRLPLFHFDAWMEGREKAWLAEGGGAWLREGGVSVIEWAGRVEAWLPEARLEGRIDVLGLESRRLTFRAIGADSPYLSDLGAFLLGLATPCGVSDGDPASSSPS